MVDLTTLLLIQSLFDLLILIMVLFLFKQIRQLRHFPLDEVILRLKKADELCQRLSANLEEKRVLSEKLLSALKTGAKAWEEGKKDAQDLKKEVARLADQGLGVAEIAQKTGLQEGEVILILSVLEKKGA